MYNYNIVFIRPVVITNFKSLKCGVFISEMEPLAKVSSSAASNSEAVGSLESLKWKSGDVG